MSIVLFVRSITQESERGVHHPTSTSIMLYTSLDNNEAIDIATAPSHFHQDLVPEMHSKAIITREPYGKPGKSSSLILLKLQTQPRQPPRNPTYTPRRLHRPVLQPIRSNMRPLRHPRRSTLRLRPRRHQRHARYGPISRPLPTREC
jgi:hypothetical protein